MVIFLVDPSKQFNKAKDAQRKEDFVQIRNALDTYYNDHNCYPADIPFGSEWRVGNTVYMKKVPQDPNCYGSSPSCYSYIIDTGSVCAQWNVLFGRLSIQPSVSSPACLLQTDCLPGNYAVSGYNYCNFGGDIDCSLLSQVTLASVDPNPTPLSTPTPTDIVQGGGGSNPTPTPSPTFFPGVPTFTPTPTDSFVPPPPAGSPTIPDSGIFYCGCGRNHVTVCNITYSFPEGVPYYYDSACSNQCGQPC